MNFRHSLIFFNSSFKLFKHMYVLGVLKRKQSFLFLVMLKIYLLLWFYPTVRVCIFSTAFSIYLVIHTSCNFLKSTSQWSQNVGAGDPHHRPHQLMASSSLDCHRLVEWGRRNELEASNLQCETWWSTSELINMATVGLRAALCILY